MKRFSLLAGAMLTLGLFANLHAESSRPNWSSSGSTTSSSSSISINSSEKYKFVGEFTVIGFAKRHSVILSNNMVYKPYHDYKKPIKDWQLNDPIRVLQTKHKNLVLLINLRTGESVKAAPHEVHKK